MTAIKQLDWTKLKPAIPEKKTTPFLESGKRLRAAVLHGRSEALKSSHFNRFKH